MVTSTRPFQVAKTAL